LMDLFNGLFYKFCLNLPLTNNVENYCFSFFSGLMVNNNSFNRRICLELFNSKNRPFIIRNTIQILSFINKEEKINNNLNYINWGLVFLLNLTCKQPRLT